MPDRSPTLDSRARALYQDRLKTFGLSFANPQRITSIPASLTPMTVNDKEWQELDRDCRLVLAALEKTAAWIRTDEYAFRFLFGHLRGLEAEAAQGKLGSGLATVRHDLFFAGDGLQILEINTTIPAMQAYSDMIRQAWVESFYPKAKAVLDRSNTRDLLQSLLALSAAHRDLPEAPAIGIVAREGDSQITELQWLKKTWEGWGHACVLGHPQDFTIHGQKTRLKGIPIDICYRHIFAERIDPHSAFAEACRHPQSYSVWNSVSAHLEIKGLLAELSRITADDRTWIQAGLNEAERLAVASRVPWTRLLRQGPSRTEDGSAIDDFAHYVAQVDPKGFVLKSSAGYGGHSVLIGEQFLHPETQTRVQSLLGIKGPVSWPQCVAVCFSGAVGPWTIQSRVPGRRKQHSILGSPEASHSSFVDASLFGGKFSESHVPGGTSRFSDQIVVNLGRGGGLLPLFLDSEMQTLLKGAHDANQAR